MPDVQTLKRQLRGIRSTQKLTKAMKATSIVKMSRLSGIYGQFSEYGTQCEKLLEQYGSIFLEAFRETDSTAPAAVIVLASNKGMCGNFNAEILNFAADQLTQLGAYRLIPCGREAIRFFQRKNLPMEKAVVFNDVPTYGESSALFDEVIEWRSAGKVSRIFMIYPKYFNMMRQSPAISESFSIDCPKADETALLIPNRSTVVENTARTVFRAMFYKLVLETALGAQAATLLTMRSAYDTATEYCAELEGKINRLRQSSITADIIETSSKSNESR